jgi:hypothetical protein
MTTSAMRCWRRCSLLLVLAGCQAEPPPDTAQHFRAELHGVSVHLALDDCEVFRVLPDGRRERVLTTDFYPMLSVCQRQEVSADAEYVLVQLGRQALGAGGCCATDGTWRSRDGQHWQRRVQGRWVEAGATPQ